MRLLLLSWCTLLLISGMLVACIQERTLVESGRGYEVTVRQAEEPTSTIRDIDIPLLDRGDDKEPEPVNFRRKRLQLRRNRYLLLQGGGVED